MDAVCLAEEFKGCDFGDARLTKRGVQIAETLSQKPHASIPAAFCTRAEFEACYRFLDNENVTSATILQPH